MDRDSPIIIPEYVLSHKESLEYLGIDVDDIFAGVQIDFQQYKKQPHPLSINQVSGLLSSCYRISGIPYLGLLTGKQTRLTMHGMAGVAAMAQPTYAECLQAASRLCDKAFPPFSTEYIETDGTVGLRIIECLSLAPHSHFFIESLLVNYYGILHFLLGEECEPEYIAFTHSDRGYGNVYRRYFSCPLRFNAEHNEFVVSRRLAQRELLLANRDIAQIAEQNFLKSLPPLNLDYLPQKLRLLLIRSMGAFPSLETAARRLGMSSRTLRRQLNGLGTNYHSELETLRREFAIQYLTASDKCITEIALMLGFCDSSAFSKSFRKWTGKSPREYKRQTQQGGALTSLDAHGVGIASRRAAGSR